VTTRPSSLKKRAAILAAAEAAFLDGGYASVTMDDIAASSGVAKQTVYAHFGSKDALFVDLVMTMTREAGDDIHTSPALIEDIAGLTGLLERNLVRQLDVVLTPRLLQLRRLVIGEVPRFPALASALATHGPHRAIEAIAGQLADASRRGILTVDDPHEAASQLNWLVMGAPLNDAMLLGDLAVPVGAQRRAHVRRALATFLAAYERTADRPGAAVTLRA
jgi:TetR/AcrR family transcriptional regulator, mexJK operon transcriptional repressor